MIRLKVFSILLFCLLSSSLLAQHSLSGVVKSVQDSSLLKDCVIYLDGGKSVAVTNAKGAFIFRDLANGNYVVEAVSPDQKYSKAVVAISGKDAFVEMTLDVRKHELKTLVITDKKVTHMSGVENLGIYEGKKSEVIVPEQMTANLSTNNARQIYNRAPGLNIWENDGAGLQLSIGGRGLDPNRTSNFNVRQNGYDISADALGYPESYYTPPLEAVGKIQIVRGAASLQYGTQFGGLINFVMKKPVTDKKIEVIARQSAGSFGFINSFVSASGTIKKLSYYSFVQYKTGDGWRKNSHFDSHTFYSNINYQFTEKTKLGIDFTQMGYLAQQPGGLSDKMFAEDPRQTNRERNWFKVNWNLFALHFDHKFNANNEFNLRVFGLSAYRYSVGFRPNRVESPDDNSERDLIKGYFNNIGAEARYLKRYNIVSKSAVLLVGSRYYYGHNHTAQGFSSKGKNADFGFVETEKFMLSDYKFPNQNTSFFLENIFNLHEKFSITPGLRYEFINTTANGFYGNVFRNLAGDWRKTTRTFEVRNNKRQFLLAGIGFSYKPVEKVNVYANASQNYRSITFSDMRIANPSAVIDPDMQDEKGYSLDFGVRSEETVLYSYDVSVFYLNYNNRIGEVLFIDQSYRDSRRRGNIGQAVIMGLETYAEADFIRAAFRQNLHWSGVLFSNIAVINSEYKKSINPLIVGNEVEFVPQLNLKTGLRLGYKNVKASFQFTHLSDQFTDGTNAVDGGHSAVIGLIPSYSIMDLSLAYQYKRFKLEGSVNNLANQMYYTRRATGYPGPGILPSDGRSFFVTLQVKI